MQDYSHSMSSLSEVQRIIGLSLSKIQIGRNQRGGLPLHKNLLVATVLNKARDLYMQETMYMNYKMMTGQLGAAQMSCMTMHTAQCNGMGPVSIPEGNSSHVEDEEEEEVVIPPGGLTPAPSSLHNNHPYEEESSKAQDNNNPPPPPAPLRNSDEGFIDEPDCDCDARNFSSESSRVPFQYCYQCAPFHPSNGRGPTLVPAAKSSLEHSSHHSSPGSEEEQLVSSPNAIMHGVVNSSATGQSPTTIESNQPINNNNTNSNNNNFTIYNMDSRETELRSPSHSSLPTRKRRLSDPSDNFCPSGGKRNRTNSCPDESEYSHLLNEGQGRPTYPISPSSVSTADNSSEEVFHPAFRQCSQNSHQYHNNPSSTGGASSPGSNASPSRPSMEIDQITSLVSIFSFGQQIMAAAAAASEAKKRLQQKSNMQQLEEGGGEEMVHRGVISEDHHHHHHHHHHSGTEELLNPSPPQDNSSHHHHLLETKKDEDSDSESDTSSDSGHSSDDLEATSPEVKCASEESSSSSSTNPPESSTPVTAAASTAAPSTPPTTTTTSSCCSAQEGSCSAVKNDGPNCCILPVAIV